MINDGKRKKSLTNISIIYEIIVAKHVICNHELRKEIKIVQKTFLFSIIVFKMMRLLAIRQVKAGKTMTKEWCRYVKLKQVKLRLKSDVGA